MPGPRATCATRRWTVRPLGSSSVWGEARHRVRRSVDDDQRPVHARHRVTAGQHLQNTDGVGRDAARGARGASLDDPVGQHISWVIPCVADADADADFNCTAGRAGVTLRRLLSHTAGLGLHGFAGFVAAARYRRRPRCPEGRLLPGRRYVGSRSGRYAGAGAARQWVALLGRRGYHVPQLLLEEAYGDDFAEIMRRRVLAARHEFERLLGGTARARARLRGSATAAAVRARREPLRWGRCHGLLQISHRRPRKAAQLSIQRRQRRRPIQYRARPWLSLRRTWARTRVRACSARARSTPCSRLHPARARATAYGVSGTSCRP